MYTKMIPYKDGKGNPRNQEVQFDLGEGDVMKLIKEFQMIFKWQEEARGEKRDLSAEEVSEFYTNFEVILLAAWGEMSDDGLYFRRSGRYDFEESFLFRATMLEFLTNPIEVGKLIDGIMPTGLEEVVKKADANLALAQSDPNTSPQVQDELARLRATVSDLQRKQSTLE